MKISTLELIVIGLAFAAALVLALIAGITADSPKAYIVRIAPTYDRSIPTDRLTYGDLGHLISENDELICPRCEHELYLELYVNGARRITGGVFVCPVCEGI